MQETLRVKTGPELDLADITGKVNAIVEKSRVEDGVCLVFCRGATGAVVINENDPALLDDFKRKLSDIIPREAYAHPGNAHSHLRAMLLGPSETIPVKNSRLDLGTWQSVFLINLDTSPREREVVVQVIARS